VALRKDFAEVMPRQLRADFIGRARWGLDGIAEEWHAEVGELSLVSRRRGGSGPSTRDRHL